MTTIEQLQHENKVLRAMLIEQGGKLERAIFSIYQLYGGLYNQNTQQYNLEHNVSYLLGSEGAAKKARDPFLCSEFTTRQGDAHEKRISQIEGKLQQLEDKVASLV